VVGDEPFLRLGAVFAIGILIEFQRGWQLRSLPEGARGADICTFDLVCLLGGIAALHDRRHLLTFGLAAMVVSGDAVLTATAATALLLDVKLSLHAWLGHLSRDELFAVLQLFVMSVVLLPVLPDRGFCPRGALNS
jgi:uncharacterized membrane protein (DUF4010 family)